jgi:hypothetical protein
VCGRRYDGDPLIAVASQGDLDVFCEFLRQNLRSAEHSFPLVGHARCQVAGASPAVLHFATRGGTKTFFDALVGLLLWHESSAGRKALGSGENLNPSL